MTLDSKALDAAQDRSETGHERALVELGIIAYIAHPAADLVEGEVFLVSLQETIKALKERDEARREIEELKADIVRHILIISDLEEER